MPTSTQHYRLVVGVDFSDTGVRALEQALAIVADRPHAELHLVAVADSDHAELIPLADRHKSLVHIVDHLRLRLASAGYSAIEAFRATHPGAHEPPLVAHVRVGPVAEQIAALATELRADMVIVGTHGRRGVRRLMLGSVAERVVRVAPCPVLVVRPHDFSAMEGLPAIEAACPDCVAARQASDGATWWCKAHAEAPGPWHAYSHSTRLDQPQSPAPYGTR